MIEYTNKENTFIIDEKTSSVAEISPPGEYGRAVTIELGSLWSSRMYYFTEKEFKQFQVFIAAVADRMVLVKESLKEE